MALTENSKLSETGPRRIRKLSSNVINQIAAGEVVERPSNLIKELVENSLDANATRIEVHLVEGGLKELTVIDDGHGIFEEDLALAVERHTTSKLKELSDLEEIGTYGFRGEALSSIASVCDFSIRSRTQSAERGLSLHVPFGESCSIKPIGCPPGTQVTAKDLFARIPARFKFLRSQTTELSHCIKTLRELALGNPQTSFFLFHNGRLLSQYTSTNRMDRMKECLKPEWEPLTFNDKMDEMSFEAFLSPPEFAQDRGEITLIINQRPVKNRFILSSLKNSFLEFLGPNLEVSGVFYLDIRGDWVDVNVHPQKLEVRFYRQEKLYSWLITSLRKQLQSKGFKSHASQISQAASEHTFNPLPYASESFLQIGFLNSHFLLCEPTNDKGTLYIINRLALQRRVLYQTLEQNLLSGKTSTTSLDLAEVIHLSSPQLKTLEHFLPELKRLGFEISLYSDKDIAVQCVPQFFSGADTKGFILKLLELLSGMAQPKTETDKINTLLHVIINLEPQSEHLGTHFDHLVSSLNGIDESWTCPNGHPVLLKITKDQLQDYFKEI